ncbi:hypothetical protein DSO57_1002381 [Entomophthora muscae]|uniref:Uncharacterized protein n=1 Tax=Entomophthora muscae TaxID=34485 RepID=A0ACC2RNN3_9FUNG|nr:hypothetical protein DSO57_1002381 [Entomophthora muscae]
MKYFVSLIFAALVYGLKEPYEVSATKELCSVNAKVFSIYPEGGNKFNLDIILITKRSVNVCKKKSGAKVFRKIYIDASNASSSKKQQFKGVFTAVEDVNFLYGDEETKFYDGFEFNIKDHNKTVVERLVKERSDDQMFSLKMTLDKWHEVGTVVNKYAAKIHHVTLDVGVDPHGFVAFEDILESCPRITFAANNDDHESAIMSLVKNHSKKINRKVGYTNYRPNDRGVEITYTAGI